MHPKVRAVLDRGLSHEWTVSEVQALLGMSLRSTQYLFDSDMLRISMYPARGEKGITRFTTGLSLLLYLLEHSDEITEADAQPIIKKVLPLLTNQILEGVAGACKALINARSGLLVAVKPAAAETAEQAAKRTARPRADPYAGMPELFPADDAGEPKDTTP